MLRLSLTTAARVPSQVLHGLRSAADGGLPEPAPPVLRDTSGLQRGQVLAHSCHLLQLASLALLQVCEGA